MGAVRRIAGPVAGLVAATVIAALIAAPVALAAAPTFGKATAVSVFLQSITVDQQATLPSGVHRVEAYVREGDGRTFLDDVPNPGAGQHRLRYVYATPSGALYPNTRLQLGFRVTLEDGTIFDSPPARILYEDTRYAWNTLEGDVVRVHWYAGSEGFGRRALQIGEKAVKDASDLLGVTETDPIDYFVYADRDAFYDVLGPAIQENVGGIALSEIRTLFANIAPSDGDAAWVGIVVPHELTHLVFATATDNPYHSPPHWMNEGLAVYLSESYTSAARGNVERAARNGEIMPIRALIGQFPTTPDRFGLAYDESVSAIDYLIRTHGQEALVGLIRSYAEGVSDDAAFSAALGADVAGFEAGWLADLGIPEPAPYGPRPAPPGPLPPDWIAAPVPSGVPGGSGVPSPTLRPTPNSEDGLGGSVVLAVLAVGALLLMLGLAVVARQLSRGQPLLAPLGQDAFEPEDGETAAQEPDAADDDDADDSPRQDAP